MDSTEKSNSSSSHSTQGPSPTVAEDNKYNVVAAKKLKMTSADDSTSEGRTEDGAGTSNTNGGFLNPNFSQSPEQFVFSIDHILESILGNSDRKTLLNCRLVSRRWAYYGSKLLQEILSIGFIKHPSHRKGPRLFRFTSDENRSLRHLINLMNKSTQFPSNSFEFRTTKPEKCKLYSAQPFYNAHGASIKKIAFHEYLDFEDLKFLLLNQASNLHELHLGQIRLIYDYTNGPFSSESEQERSLYDKTALNPKPILKNLKTLQCHFSAKLPPLFMQQILDCSPNLVSVALPNDALHFLVQPTNRLHLLQTLTIDIDSSNVETHELVAHHLQEHPNVAVRELTYCNAHKDDERVTNVMGKYLRACAATVQKLVWSKGVSNLQFPKMPRVKDLTIQCHSSGEPPSLVTSLGGGVSLGDTFSNLKFLEVTSKVVLEDLPIANIFTDDSDDDPIPAANVKKVTLRLLLRPGQNVLQSFMQMFPNASILNKIEVRRAYYEQYDDDEDDDDEYGEEGDYYEEEYYFPRRYRYYDFDEEDEDDELCEEEDDELCEEEDEDEEICEDEGEQLCEEDEDEQLFKFLEDEDEELFNFLEEHGDYESKTGDDIEDEGNTGDDVLRVPSSNC